MKILLINGSLHEKGACAGVIAEVKNMLSATAVEFSEYRIGSAPRYACSGCLGCKGGNGCIYRDIDSLTEIFSEANATIICTPTHYAAAPGNLTSVLSRLVFSSKKSVQYKPIGVIGVGRRGGLCEAIRDVKKFFEFASCPIISGIYPALLYADGYENRIFDDEGSQNVRSLVSNLIFITRCIDLGRKNGILPPSDEKRIKTDIPSLKQAFGI